MKKMISTIIPALVAVWALALLAAGEGCHPNKPIENEDFKISCENEHPGFVTLQCKSEANRWANFPKERINLAGFDVIIEGCGFPDDGDFRLLEYINSLALREIKLLKFVEIKTSLAPNLLSGMSVYTFEIYDSELITELPSQLLHGMQIGARFWHTKTNVTEVPPNFFLNQRNITYVDLNFNEIKKLDRAVFEPLVKLKKLLLSGNQLTEIEEGLFDQLTDLENLDISNNMLTTLPPSIFNNLKSLITLHMSANQFTDLPADLLRNQNEHLTSFKMNINRGIMKTMPGSFFKNHRKLETVELKDNQFISLPPDLFIGTESLKSVNLYTNEITELPSNIFADAPNLKILTLSNNQLSKLPDYIFNENTILEELYLDNNRLTNITENVLHGLNRLRVLDVSHNSLVEMVLSICNDNLNSKLEDVNISYNNLTLYGDFANCVGIKKIIASNNNISKIIPVHLINKIYLVNLNLANNRITDLPLSEISQQPVMNSLSFLNVSNNQISSINMTNYIEPKEKLTVDVSRNPLYCDCYVYDFLHFIESIRWSISYESHFTFLTKDLTCVGPSQLAGRSIEKVSSSELMCPIVSNATSDACTELCTCYENPGNKRLIVDCSNRKLKSVPAVISNSQNWSIALNMSGNDLQITPDMNQSYLSRVVSIDLSGNNISIVTLEVFSGSLRELQLHNNRITQLEPNVIEHLIEDTQLMNLTLHQNNWNCDCQATTKKFLNFVQTKLSEFQLDKVKCHGTNKLLSTMTANELCENATAIIVGASLVIAFISVAVGVLAALYYKYQKEIKIWLYSKQLCLWFVTENELDKDKKYDAFISFSHKDEDFVVNEIINKLEAGPNPYKLCVHYRDWLAGEWITEQIARSVEESRRTIVVLSPNFLDSTWGGMEFRTAHNKALKEGRARVILILYGDIGNPNDLDPELKAYLNMNTYVKWGDPWFWDKLRYALPHKYETSRRKSRPARIMESHLAQMSVAAHDSNDKAEIIPMPNINATTQDSAKLLDPRSEENKL